MLFMFSRVGRRWDTQLSYVLSLQLVCLLVEEMGLQ